MHVNIQKRRQIVSALKEYLEENVTLNRNRLVLRVLAWCENEAHWNDWNGEQLVSIFQMMDLVEDK